MKVGYVRVSTIGQNTARQEVLMQELGVERVFIDRQSGKDTSRPELQRLLEFVREGDVVVVESISRFARCTKDLLELIEQLAAKGVEFISKKESLDTSTPSGRFVLTIFGAVAQLEREYLLQRQKEGIAIAKQEGKYKGRKPLERDGQSILAQRRNDRGGGNAEASNVQDHLLPPGESNGKEGANMNELICFTLGFVIVLVVITAADTFIRCSTK